MSKKKQTPSKQPKTTAEAQDRSDYQAPKVTKKKSVKSVTLFSGGGATAGGLTASG